MDGFKQRIFGALIIVSLAVIFLPMMFDEPHEERTSRVIDIPDQPESPDARVDEPREPEPAEEPEPPEEAQMPEPVEVDDPPADEEPPQTAQEEAVPEEPDSPEPAEPETEASDSEDVASIEEEGSDSAVLEGSYLIQLASFGSSDNARNFRDQARDAGFEAYVEEFTRDGDSFHRVFAGPFTDRDEAEAAKTEIDDALSVEGLVVAAGE